MEEKALFSYTYFDTKELKEREESYNKCLVMDESDDEDIPSLKYAFYNLNMLNNFDSKIEQIKNEIKEIKTQLNNYKGNIINCTEENKKLDEIINELIIIEKESDTQYFFDREYLINTAKKSDTLKDDVSKNVYIKTSEDILKNRIKCLMKYEKKFLIFEDIINKLRNSLNVW